MRVKLKTIYAKAGLAAQAGAIIEVEDKEAGQLISGGYAEEVSAFGVDVEGAREQRAAKGAASKREQRAAKGAAAAEEAAVVAPAETAVVAAAETAVVDPPEVEA